MFPETNEPPIAFQVMAKPIGPICNLDCTYCYYLEKEHVLGTRPSSWRMDEALLEDYVRQYIEAQDVPQVDFAWQGGEPTLLGIDFFRKAVAFQEKFANGKKITNAFQTNGTLLNDDWAKFFRENNFLIGLSIDGPRALHDGFRVDKGGKPTFDRVIRGVELLHKHGVQFNTLTVVQSMNAQHPLKVYDFLKKVGSGFMQFIPLVERLATDAQKEKGYDHSPPSPDDEHVDEWSSVVSKETVRPVQFGKFLTTIFDEWVRKDVGDIYVQAFEEAFGKWVGAPGGLCLFRERCGTALVVESNGDLYSCDHFVYPEYKLGNIREKTMRELVATPEQRAFGNHKADSLPKYCRECAVRFACNGECPKKRFIRTPEGEPGLNFLCAGYKHFFTHITPFMNVMAKLFAEGQNPALIKEILAQKEGRKVAPVARTRR